MKPITDIGPVFGDGDMTTPTSGDGDMPTVAPTPGDGDMTTPTPGDGDMTGLGDGGMQDDDDAGTGPDSPQCQNLNPNAVDVSALTQPLCDRELCTNAHCLPPAAVPDAKAAERLGTCSNGNLCVPDVLIASGGNFVLKSCRSLGDAEGRCISSCVPQVADQADRLPQDVCAAGELCAPCFDPITGEDTGSCSQSCDSGPAEPKKTFAECCGGLSVCVPKALVPAEQLDQLDANDCEGADMLCAPKAQAADPDFVPKRCDSLAGAEGRCLPACLPAVADRADNLPQDVCESGEVCAPCYDPFSGEPTPACAIGDDMPVDPPVTFAGCCDAGGGNTLGTCVPEVAVPEQQKPLLGADTCSMEGDLCAPTEVALGTYMPAACTAVGDGEGRCLPACLPPVASKADTLDADVCADGLLCVPCFDPVSGDDTNACRLGDDEPTMPPTVFQDCCDDGSGSNPLGKCVPAELAGDQVDILPTEDCDSEGFACAPKLKIADPTAKFPSCQTKSKPCANVPAGATRLSCQLAFLVGGLDDKAGGCVPRCVLELMTTGDENDPVMPAELYTQSDCDLGSICAPCINPSDNTETPACQ